MSVPQRSVREVLARHDAMVAATATFAGEVCIPALDGVDEQPDFSQVDATLTRLGVPVSDIEEYHEAVERQRREILEIRARHEHEFERGPEAQADSTASRELDARGDELLRRIRTLKSKKRDARAFSYVVAFSRGPHETSTPCITPRRRSPRPRTSHTSRRRVGGSRSGKSPPRGGDDDPDPCDKPGVIHHRRAHVELDHQQAPRADLKAVLA